MILQLCHLPPPVLPSVSNSSCLLPGLQPLEASCCTILLFFWRYRTAGWKMFSLFFALVFVMDYLCEKCHKPSTVPHYIAICVSWVPRLTLLDSWTNWPHKHALQMEHICSQGTYCKHLLSSIQEKTNVWNILRSVWEQLDFIYLKFFFFFKSLLNLLQCSFCFIFWFFSHKAYGVSAPQPEIKPTLPGLEREVLTIRPPGKSCKQLDFKVLTAFLTVVVLVSNFTDNCMGLWEESMIAVLYKYIILFNYWTQFFFFFFFQYCPNTFPFTDLLLPSPLVSCLPKLDYSS